MNEIVTFSPILILVAMVITFVASYTALDLFAPIFSTERNKRLLFWGGTFSFGIGIWVMNFIGMLAINIDSFAHYRFSFALLSMFFGVMFTAIAFKSVVHPTKSGIRLIIGSLFMTAAVLCVHMTGMVAIGAGRFDSLLLAVAACVLFFTFMFAFWIVFFSKSLMAERLFWLKPVSAIVMTGGIVVTYFLLIRAVSLEQLPVFSLLNIKTDFIMAYFAFFMALLILGGLMGSKSLLSRKLASSDNQLNDIKAALDESSIVAITDSDGIITYVNDKFVEISKYNREELIGKTHSILNSGFHSKEFFTQLWKTIQSGEIWRGEIRNKSKDGSYYWVETTIVPFLDNKGKPYQFVSIRTDITQLKRVEEHLKSSLREVNDITFALDQSTIVAFTDAKGRITKVNDMLCEISKYSREELIGQDHKMLNSGLHSKSFFQNLWETIRSGKVWKGEIRNRAKDGSYYWVDTTIVPFLNEAGEPYQYLAIRNDITERKRTEEILHRQDKLAAVGQLAAGVAHEIRNPLTSMKGYAEFLLLDEEDEQRKEFIDIILDEIERVNHIVEDFMVLAKPKADSVEEKNIIPIIENVVSLLEFEAKKRKVTIHFAPHESIIQIECDENRLKQVFLNFIKNGIEAMPNGGEISIKTHIHQGQLQISIKDTGIGIPEEKLKNIGEPFYTTKKSGNGLGLMVSFKIIENHNGKVYIESELNKGTTFNILLPAKTA